MYVHFFCDYRYTHIGQNQGKVYASIRTCLYAYTLFLLILSGFFVQAVYAVYAVYAGFYKVPEKYIFFFYFNQIEIFVV